MTKTELMSKCLNLSSYFSHYLRRKFRYTRKDEVLHYLTSYYLTISNKSFYKRKMLVMQEGTNKLVSYVSIFLALQRSLLKIFNKGHKII